MLLVRITYLGELGYELYVPADDALDRVRRRAGRGEPHGLARSGSRRWPAADGEGLPRLRPRHRQHRPRASRPGSASPSTSTSRRLHRSRGRAAASQGRGACRRAGSCRCGCTDPEPLLYHAELVLRDGDVVGYVRAASYGWTLGGAVGLAMVDGGVGPLTADWLKAGTWTVDVAGTAYDAVVSLRPMYDPTERADQGPEIDSAATSEASGCRRRRGRSRRSCRCWSGRRGPCRRSRRACRDAWGTRPTDRAAA